jgi:hypothetical protein
MCTISFLEVSLWRSWTSSVVLVVLVLLLQGIDYRSGLFFYCNSSFFGMCASIMPLGHHVVAEARCSCYLCDINIFPLSKKECTIERGIHDPT